jgi:hypothetical protein
MFMATKPYKELYERLQEVGYFDRLLNPIKVGAFKVKRKLGNQSVEVITDMFVNTRLGNVTKAITVVEFFGDGSAWVTVPSKLEEALGAVNAVIANFKKEGEDGKCTG